MWLEMDDAIRLRVKGVKFRKAPNAQQLRSASEPSGDMLGTAANPFAPMQVRATLLLSTTDVSKEGDLLSPESEDF